MEFGTTVDQFRKSVKLVGYNTSLNGLFLHLPIVDNERSNGRVGSYDYGSTIKDLIGFVFDLNSSRRSLENILDRFDSHASDHRFVPKSGAAVAHGGKFKCTDTSYLREHGRINGASVDGFSNESLACIRGTEKHERVLLGTSTIEDISNVSEENNGINLVMSQNLMEPVDRVRHGQIRLSKSQNLGVMTIENGLPWEINVTIPGGINQRGCIIVKVGVEDYVYVIRTIERIP